MNVGGKEEEITSFSFSSFFLLFVVPLPTLSLFPVCTYKPMYICYTHTPPFPSLSPYRHSFSPPLYPSSLPLPSLPYYLSLLPPPPYPCVCTSTPCHSFLSQIYLYDRPGEVKFNPNKTELIQEVLQKMPTLDQVASLTEDESTLKLCKTCKTTATYNNCTCHLHWLCKMYQHHTGVWQVLKPSMHDAFLVELNCCHPCTQSELLRLK